MACPFCRSHPLSGWVMGPSKTRRWGPRPRHYCHRRHVPPTNFPDSPAAWTPIFDEAASVPGITAFPSSLRRLKNVAPVFVPFVRLFYGQEFECSWWDADVPAMVYFERRGASDPALFAPGHDGLQQPRREGESFMVFFWTTFILCCRTRSCPRGMTGCVETHTGIAANRGKTRVFNFAGKPARPRVAEQGPGMLRGDKPLAEHPIVALGTPIGTAETRRRGVWTA